jgi:hypothetical protein
MTAYLPKESILSPLSKSVMRDLWNNKIIAGALGLKNELEAREWFRDHPQVHSEFEAMNWELKHKIAELQNRAIVGLQAVVVHERTSKQIKDEPF